MTLITLFSSLAVVVGVAASFPQIVTMFQARSSAGQSALGWCLGVLVNGLLGYVNLVGAQSAVLATGNALGLLLSATALALVLRYRGSAGVVEHAIAEPVAAVRTLLDSPHSPLVELKTAELEALHGAVADARETRERRHEFVSCAA